MEIITSKSIRKKHQKLMRLATYFSVCTALIIIIVKVSAWIHTDSLSMLASLADSVLDGLASIINLLAVHYALQPADEEHRFGHTKAEDIAAFAQSAFIAGSGLFIVIESIGRAIDPHPLQNELAGIVVMVISTILTIALVLFQRYVIKKTNSGVVKADFLHYSTDLAVNGIVIISLLASMFMNMGTLDTIASFLIAAYIFRGAWEVGRGAFDNLMDKEMPVVDKEKIIECIFTNQKVRGIHDLRTRVSGIKNFVQFHVELDGNMTLREANKIADNLENKLETLFPNTEVIVHQDPENDSGEESIRRKISKVKMKNEK
jgi:ferrous-iron efflux pump FieF